MAQESFYTSSSWTCPVGVSSITVECWGAGGSGAGDANAAGAGGGGGADGSNNHYDYLWTNHTGEVKE